MEKLLNRCINNSMCLSNKKSLSVRNRQAFFIKENAVIILILFLRVISANEM